MAEVGELLDFGNVKGCRLGRSLLRDLHSSLHLNLFAVVAEERVMVSLENIANAVGSGEAEDPVETQHAAGKRGRSAAGLLSGLLSEGANGNRYTKHRESSGHKELRMKTVGWKNCTEHGGQGQVKNLLCRGKDGHP